MESFAFEIGESCYLFTNDGYEPVKVLGRYTQGGFNYYTLDLGMFSNDQKETFLRKTK